MAETPRWIAVVDDDASVLKALKRALRVRGFETRTYESAKQFLAAVADGLPECLVVDLQMPEMTGLELHHSLTGAGIQIPTIIITAHADAKVLERSEAAGIIAVFSKPLRTQSLFAAIDGVIRGGRSPDQQTSWANGAC